jgi:DNA-binding CsgD family transcriptional regulator
MESYSDEMVLAGVIKSAGTPDFLPSLLDYMREKCSFRGALVSHLSQVAAPVHIYDNVRAQRRSIVVDRWLDTAWTLDPYAVAYLQSEHQPVMTLDMVAPDRFKQSEYYETYYRSIRLRDEMGVFVDLGDDVLFFSLGRLVGENRFSRRDVSRLRQVHPIIAALCEQHFFNRRGGVSPVGGHRDAMTKMGGDLTDRETEVVNLILRGHSSRSVALRLNVSVETIKVHRRNVYRKLNISSEASLFALFLNST